MHLIKLESYVLDETVKYLHTYVYFPIPTKLNTCTNKLSVCPIALFSMFTKVINEIRDISFAIIFKKMLSIFLFFTECKPRYAYKEKACIYRYRKSKIGKYYVLFSAVSLLISDILQCLINRCSINMY